MSKIYSFLVEVKEKLINITSVKTVKIGLEKGIGSKDCPFIRIIPEINNKVKDAPIGCGSGGQDNMTIQVVFGFDIKNQELEKLYEEYYELEQTIRAKLLVKYPSGHLKFIHTVTDEDKIPNIKSAISRFEIVGIR